MPTILKEGEHFYCMSKNGTILEYKFLRIAPNKKMKMCSFCKEKNKANCIPIAYYILADDRNDITCLGGCIKHMYFDKFKVLPVTAVEGYDPEEFGHVVPPKLEPVSQYFNTTNFIGNHRRNFTTEYSNTYGFYSSNFVFRGGT